MKPLADIIATCAERERWELRASYSGRGMSDNETCVGVVTDDGVPYVLSALICDIVDEYYGDELPMTQLLIDATDIETDDMGQSEIIYWPNLDGEGLEDDDDWE